MALQRKGANWAFGADGVSAAGIVEVTGYSCRREYTTQIEGKDHTGEIGAFLYGGEKFTLSVEGYATSQNLPSVGGTITVGGVTGTIMNVEVTGSNEDFTRCRVEGIGYPAIT